MSLIESAQEVAELVGPLVQPRPEREPARRSALGTLLTTTLVRAKACSPLYAERFQDFEVEGIEIDTLPRLPALTRRDVEQHLPQLVVSDETPPLVRWTSGTTSAPLLTLKSANEAAFLFEVFRALAGDHPGPWRTSFDLELNFHGAGIMLYPSSVNLPFGGYELFIAGGDTPFRLAAQLEGVPGITPRVTDIFGSTGNLLFLTHYLRTRRFDFAKHPIESITVSASHLSPARRSTLESAWSAPVFDKYGVSEIFGNATSCSDCGAYHFDPFVVPEIVDLNDTSRPVDAGIGQLLLTSLYPFTQMTPLIRYATTDLVERVPAASACGDPWAIKPLGRIGLAPAQKNARGHLELEAVPADFLDALDEIPDIARLRRFAGVEGVDPGAGSRPRVRFEALSEGPISSRYTIELRYDPLEYPARKREITDQLQAALVDGARARGFHEPRVAIDLVGPNVLNDPREFRFK